jgi:clan AA aspartic protease
MGLVYADLELVNSGDIVLAKRGYILPDDVRRIRVSALVDSGAYMMCINENLKNQLGLDVVDTMEAEMADGRLERLDVVGPVEVIFENRSTSCRAAVLPGDAEVLLGSIPMEDMDVVVLPKEQRLVVNPATPYIAKKKIK